MKRSSITHFLSTNGSLDIASSNVAISMPTKLDLGRFRIHFEKNALPEVRIVTLTDGPGVIEVPGEDSAEIADISLWIIAPDGATQIVINSVPGKDDSDSLSQELGLICFNRSKLRLGGENLVDFTRRRLAELGISGNIDLGADVHQFVLLGDEASNFYSTKWPNRVIEETPPEIIAMSYRESTEIAKTSKQVGLRVPLELNRRRTEICAHGRGVTVIGGHDESIINTIMYTASKLLFGLARTRSIRRELIANLESFSEISPLSDLKEAHDRAATRSKSVREHGLRISTEVESLIDGLSIPEMVIDSYRKSLRASLDIESNLEVTNRLLERVTSIVESQREDLYLNLRAAESINQSRWSTLVSAATAITLPLALLFSYLGISDSPDRLKPVPWLIAGLFALLILFISWRVKVRNTKQFKRSLKENS